DKRPKYYSALSDNCERYADPGGHSDRLRNKIRTGSVNADKKRHEFENDRDKAANACAQECSQPARGRAYAAQHEPNLGNPKRVIRKFQKDNGQKTLRITTIKLVYQIFE